MKYGESFTDRESDGYEDDEIFMSDSDPDEPSCLLKESTATDVEGWRGATDETSEERWWSITQGLLGKVRLVMIEWLVVVRWMLRLDVD